MEMKYLQIEYTSFGQFVFATYDVAEGYARFYHDIYGEQYKFRVVGLKDGV